MKINVTAEDMRIRVLTMEASVLGRGDLPFTIRLDLIDDDSSDYVQLRSGVDSVYVHRQMISMLAIQLDRVAPAPEKEA